MDQLFKELDVSELSEKEVATKYQAFLGNFWEGNNLFRSRSYGFPRGVNSKVLSVSLR